MSDLEQRPILVTADYCRHTEASKRGYKRAHLTGQNLLVLLVGLPFSINHSGSTIGQYIFYVSTEVK